MTKTLYEFNVAMSYDDDLTEQYLCSGYMASYKDALKRAFETADAIAPEETIISIKKKAGVFTVWKNGSGLLDG